MHHQRHAHGLKVATRQLGAVRGSRGRHAVTKDVGEADTALFQQSAVGNDPRAATAATGPLPGVLDELLASVCRRQGGADTVLQIHQIGFYRGNIGGAGLVLFHVDSLRAAQAPRMTWSVCRSRMILGLRAPPNAPGTTASSSP